MYILVLRVPFQYSHILHANIMPSVTSQDGRKTYLVIKVLI